MSGYARCRVRGYTRLCAAWGLCVCSGVRDACVPAACSGAPDTFLAAGGAPPGQHYGTVLRAIAPASPRPTPSGWVFGRRLPHNYANNITENRPSGCPPRHGLLTDWTGVSSWSPGHRDQAPGRIPNCSLLAPHCRHGRSCCHAIKTCD